MPSSCISAVTSGARDGVKAATPQNNGGRTRNIDIIAPPATVSSDHTLLPASCRAI